MAILKDLLNSTNFEAVMAVFQAANEDAGQYRQTYEELFNLLREAEPAENTEHMTLRMEVASDPWVLYGDDDEPEEEPEEYLQICGYIPGDNEGYGIGLKEPTQLAGLDVAEETLEQYDAATVVAHVIAEITYSRTTTESLWGSKMSTYAGGLYASQACTENELGDLSIDALRKQLGLLPEEEKEDYKEKYGFLF